MKGQLIEGGVHITSEVNPKHKQLLSQDALNFVSKLHRRFNENRKSLLTQRNERQKNLSKDNSLNFLPETASIRNDANWKVAPTPPDLQKRYVEITGPVEKKMMINALNSGANIFMADFEDSLSPTWENIIQGQENLFDTVRKMIEFISPEGKKYSLNDEIAVLMVRPRGLHLEEKHVLVNGEKISASLFDFGMYFFHNAKKIIELGSGPYFYLPKMQSHLEARFWNEVFQFSQDELGIPRGTIRATVLIETIFAAFQMEEILYELREHISGLNAGRWDYIFSIIKAFSKKTDFIFPDRHQITMTVPFMKTYTELLIKTCHKRGAHAMGGMSAFVPSRKDKSINEVALQKVQEDKIRESQEGFDGTWVAHPDLVPIAKEVFEQKLQGKPNQKDGKISPSQITPKQLLDFHISGGKVTELGFRHNISIAILYLESWLKGIGAVALYNLMEDAATAEISRAQIWQWVNHPNTILDNGNIINKDLYSKLLKEELVKISSQIGEKNYQSGKFEDAKQILDTLVLASDFPEFLTTIAYEKLS